MKRTFKIFILALIAIMAVSIDVLAGERCYGLYIGDNVSTSDIRKASSLYSSPPCMVLLFYDSTWYPSAAQLQVIGDANATPVITIEPWNARTKVFAGPNAEYVKGLADSVNDYGKEVYIRYAHEMNGNWYPWAGDPERYINEYRRFHDSLSQKLTNKDVKWIFSVNNEDIPRSNKATLYYPGDEYVDIIGLDGYINEPSWIKRLYIKFRGPFEFIFGQQMGTFESSGKPMMITETGVASEDDFKANVISSILLGPLNRTIWFDINKEADWRIVSGIKSLEYFKKGIKDRE